MFENFGKLLPAAVLLISCAGCADHFKQGVDAYRKADYSTAMKELRPLAENGDASAQNYVGFMYDNGQGVPVDYKLAGEWYSKAAEQGNEVAQHNLGLLYGNGLGVQQDWVQALKWINLAVIISKSRHTQAVKDGNYAVTQMTPEQIKEAERLTDQWLANHRQILNNQ
ncbi:MAG: tetratricopeptide repeat protein [Gallionellaceae bacterium]